MPTSPDINANGQVLFSIQLRALSEALDGNGVAGQSDLKVTDGSGDNESDISTGTAYYDGNSGTLGSSTTVTHSDGDSDNDRWDLIAFDVNNETVNLREGTAEVDPMPPTLNSDEVLLALVYIESEQTDFGSDAIINWRILGGTGVSGSDDGSEVLDRITDIDADDGLTASDGGGGSLNLDTDPGNGLENTGGQIAVSTDAIKSDELDQSIAYTFTAKQTFSDSSVAFDIDDQAADPTANGEVTRNGSDIKIYSGGSVVNVSTLVDESRSLTGGNAIDSIGDLSQDRTIAVSSSSIDSDELVNDSVTVAGNTVSLGSSTTVAVGDLSDVATSSLSAGETLLYDATDSQFENATITAGTGLTRTTGDASLSLAVDEGNGLEFNSSTLRINPTDIAGDGLKEASATSMAVEPDDIAGAGLADDGSDNLEPDTNDSGTLTATGGSDPAVDTTVTTTLSQTDPFDVLVYVDSDPAFDADYAFNWEYSHSWDDANSNLELDIVVTWDTDPGGGNDVTLKWEVLNR